MKKLISIILALTMIFSVFAMNITSVKAEETNTSANFMDVFKANSKLVWHDEFDGDKLDTTKWSIQRGWGRAGAEIFSGQEDGNVSVANGCVKLRAYEKATKENRINLSAELNSKAAWSDGLIEIRAKLPKGKGHFPAIWTMGRYYDPKGNGCLWPWSGEIDLMEADMTTNKDVNNCNTFQTLHTAKPFSMNYSSNTAAWVQTGNGHYSTPDRSPLNNEFHTFWVYLDGSTLTVGVDEYMMKTQDLNKNPNLAAFKDWEQWLILGLQMGGMGGTPERTSYSVWEMLIDYVRVYRLDNKEDYKNFKLIDAESLEHTGKNTTEWTFPAAADCAFVRDADLSFNFKDIEAGNYDVYINYSGIYNGQYAAYFNGQKAESFSLNKSGNSSVKFKKIGSITLEEDTDFQLKFKGNGHFFLDKFYFVKTDNKSNIVLNKENALTRGKYFEVATEDELIDAVSRLKKGGTVKLLNDIKLTKKTFFHCETNLDLNGKTLTATKDAFTLVNSADPITIKNGNIDIPSGATGFVTTVENHNNALICLEDVKVDINTANSGYLFNDWYGNITAKCNNCTFNYGQSVSNTNPFKLSKRAATYNNCTFNLNGKTAISIENNRNLQFNSCVVNDAKYLFTSESALSNANIKLANTKFNNLGALTNYEENAWNVSVSDCNVMYDEDGDIYSPTFDMSGNFTMTCDHSYNYGNCTQATACMYCYKEEGEKPKGHISDGGTVTREANCYYSEITTYRCMECGEVLEEVETAPIKGHNISYELLGENTCTTMQYYKCSCLDCDYYYHKGAGTDISGAYTYKGHVIDESTKVPYDSGCTGDKGFRYTCKTCGKENLGYGEHMGTHDIYSTNFTAPTENTTGSVTYRCRGCSFNHTRTIKAGEHIVTLDGVKYFTIDGDYFTPYQYEESFLYYVDEEGNQYGSDELIQTDKDITLRKVTIEEHEHIPDISAEKNVVDPTCGKQGYTEYICTICNKIFKADFTSATGNHTPDISKDKVVASTCKVKGYTEHTCAVCSTVYKDTYTDIDPEAHKPKVVSGKQPTCSKTGLTEGSVCTTCGKILVEQEEIPTTAHTPKTLPAKQPTCSKTGLTEGSQCSVCKKILVAQEVIPKLAHTIVADLGKFPSCSEEGLTMGSHCSVCNEVIVAQEVIPKLPHQEQIQLGYAPNCTKPGLTDRIWCGICGEVIQEAQTIPVLPHNFILKGEKAASYTAKGYTGDTVCSVCGEVESYGKEIPRKTLKKPTIKLSKKGNKLTVTIKKVTGAKKYEILIKIGKKWKKFTTKKLKFTKKLTKGKKYQVKVRAIAGTNKSKYSGIKKIKL